MNLPAVRYLASYPVLMRSTSMSRAGNRGISFVEYADPFWQIEMQTAPLRGSERLLVETFRDRVEGGMVTVEYTPKHQCIPKAYWGDADNALLNNAGTVVSITDGREVEINSIDNGLTLGSGDLIGFSQNGKRAMGRVTVGGVGTGNAITVSVEPFVPGFITTGAVVDFKHPKLNMRVVPGSFSMANDLRPSASWTMVEVPK